MGKDEARAHFHALSRVAAGSLLTLAVASAAIVVLKPENSEKRPNESKTYSPKATCPNGERVGIIGQQSAVERTNRHPSENSADAHNVIKRAIREPVENPAVFVGGGAYAHERSGQQSAGECSNPFHAFPPAVDVQTSRLAEAGAESIRIGGGLM